MVGIVLQGQMLCPAHVNFIQSHYLNFVLPCYISECSLFVLVVWVQAMGQIIITFSEDSMIIFKISVDQQLMLVRTLMIGSLTALWAANNQNVNTVVARVNWHLYATGFLKGTNVQPLCLCVDNVAGICPYACVYNGFVTLAVLPVY